jgi:hypothetical protein
MKEWRVARISIINHDAAHELAEKLNQMSQEGWDIDGMEVMDKYRDKMIIIASRDKEGKE